MTPTNTAPKLHNAMWTGLVGKGGDGAEPAIDLDTLLDLTASAEVDGVRFDGVDLFLFDPHVSIDSTKGDLRKLVEKVQSRNLVIGSLVAPVWAPTGGGSAMGSEAETKAFLTQVRKACRIAVELREARVRPYGVIRIDSATSVAEWAMEPRENTRRIAKTFREACVIAADHGERLAAEGEICWGGMHSWKQMVQLLETVDRPETLGFQADMAHTLLYTLGANAPEDRILPRDFQWDDTERLQGAIRTVANALRPWTIDFHVAQSDGTVYGSGTHDKTGRHCQTTDTNGRLDITRDAGPWLRGADGEPTRSIAHLCWDGCMFPNEVMLRQETWNNVLSAMSGVREAHGWSEEKVRGADRS